MGLRDQLAIAMWENGKTGSWDHDNPPWSRAERNLYTAAADAAITTLGDLRLIDDQGTEAAFWAAYDKNKD